MGRLHRLADRAGNKAAWERLKGWQQFVQDASEGHAGPLHKWTKPPPRWAPPRSGAVKAPTAQQSVDEEAGKWFKIWGSAP